MHAVIMLKGRAAPGMTQGLQVARPGLWRGAACSAGIAQLQPAPHTAATTPTSRQGCSTCCPGTAVLVWGRAASLNDRLDHTLPRVAPGGMKRCPGGQREGC